MRALFFTRRSRAWILLTAALGGIFLVTAPAAPLTWDADTTNTGAQDGSGTWNTNGNANWYNGTGDQAWTSTSTAADTAAFGVGGTSGTVTLSGTVYVGGLTFSQGGYMLSGGTASLVPTGGTVVVDTAAGTTTISSVLTGSSSLTKNGAGTLSLTAGNTFTGGIVLNAGTLAVLSRGDSLGAAPASAPQITFGGNSTLQIGINNLTAARLFTINSGVTATIDTGTNTGSGVQGVISGAGSLTKIGTGTLTLAGNNTYAGTTAVNAGTLLVNGAHTGTGAVSVNNSGSLLGGTGTLPGAVTVNGPAAITGGTAGGTGTLNLTGGLTLAGISGGLATYQVDVSGANADRLAVTGNLDLSTLYDRVTVNVVSAATAGSYAIATFGSLTGTFDNAVLPAGYSLRYTATEIDLIVAVPEPATWTAGALLCVAAVWTGRQRGRVRSLCP